MTEPQRTRGMSIQKWMTLLLLTIFLPLAVLQGYLYYDYYQEQQKAALQANLEIARAVAKSFDSFVQDVIRQEHAIGLAITSSDKMTPGDIIRLLETSSDYPAVRDFNWLNPQGVVIYSNNPAIPGSNYSDRSFVRDVVNGQEWAVGELVVGKIFGKPVFGIARGIRDDKGKLLGIIFAAILPEKLNTQLAVERSAGGAISLVDRTGMLVYRFPAIETTWEERNWLRQYPEYAEVFQGREISRTFFATYEGKERLVGIVPISPIGWAAGAGKRKEDVTGPIIRSLARDAILFLSVSVIAFLIVSVLARRITAPLQVLGAYASALGEGETPQRVETNLITEVQVLEEAFDAMAEQVRSRETDLRAGEERLREEHKKSNWLARFPEENPNPVLRVSGEGKILYCNPAATKSAEWRSAVGGFIPDPALSLVKQAIEERRDVQQDVGMLDRTCSITISPFPEEGYANVYGNDVTERRRTEEALKKSEEKFLKTFQSSPICVGLSRLTDGLVIEANDVMLQVLGYEKEELIGHKMTELGVWENPADRERLMRKLAADGRSLNQEYWLRTKSGKLLLCNHSAELIQIGAEPHVIFTFYDITERKRAAEEMQKLAAVVRYSNEFINIATLDGMMVFLNEAGAKMVGLSAEEVEQTHILQVVPDHLRKKVTDEILPALLGGGLWAGELQYLNRKTGGLTDVHATTFTIKDPESGSPLFLANTSIDITELKRAEVVLRRRQAEVQALFDNTPAGLVLFDAAAPYTVLVHNKYYQELFAEPYRSQGMVGLNIYEYAPEVEAAGIAAVFDEVVQTRQARSFLDFPYKSNPAKETWFNWHMAPILLDGKAVALVSMSIDVTDYHQAQENLRAANELLELRVRERTMELEILTQQLEKGRDDLRMLAAELVLAEERERKRIATILHDEIAQTLAVARMRVDMLQGITADDAHRQTLNEAKEFLLQSIRETRALMNDVGNPLLFDMGVAAACESLAERLMASHPIQIRCNIRESFKNLDPEVKVILFQFVRELLNNVIKHSSARNAEVRIRMDRGRIRASVKDDGVGFDQQMLGAPTAEGGFGLFSMRERLMAFRGELQIVSSQGGGAEVTIDLPIDMGRSLIPMH